MQSLQMTAAHMRLRIGCAADGKTMHAIETFKKNDRLIFRLLKKTAMPLFSKLLTIKMI